MTLDPCRSGSVPFARRIGFTENQFCTSVLNANENGFPHHESAHGHSCHFYFSFRVKVMHDLRLSRFSRFRVGRWFEES